MSLAPVAPRQKAFRAHLQHFAESESPMSQAKAMMAAWVNNRYVLLNEVFDQEDFQARKNLEMMTARVGKAVQSILTEQDPTSAEHVRFGDLIPSEDTHRKKDKNKNGQQTSQGERNGMSRKEFKDYEHAKNSGLFNQDLSKFRDTLSKPETYRKHRRRVLAIALDQIAGVLRSNGDEMLSWDEAYSKLYFTCLYLIYPPQSHKTESGITLIAVLASLGKKSLIDKLHKRLVGLGAKKEDLDTHVGMFIEAVFVDGVAQEGGIEGFSEYLQRMNSKLMHARNGNIDAPGVPAEAAPSRTESKISKSTRDALTEALVSVNSCLHLDTGTHKSLVMNEKGGKLTISEGPLPNSRPVFEIKLRKLRKSDARMAFEVRMIGNKGTLQTLFVNTENPTDDYELFRKNFWNYRQIKWGNDYIQARRNIQGFKDVDPRDATFSVAEIAADKKEAKRTYSAVAKTPVRTAVTVEEVNEQAFKAAINIVGYFENLMTATLCPDGSVRNTSDFLEHLIYCWENGTDISVINAVATSVRKILVGTVVSSQKRNCPQVDSYFLSSGLLALEPVLTHDNGFPMSHSEITRMSNFDSRTAHNNEKIRSGALGHLFFQGSPLPASDLRRQIYESSWYRYQVSSEKERCSRMFFRAKPGDVYWAVIVPSEADADSVYGIRVSGRSPFFINNSIVSSGPTVVCGIVPRRQDGADSQCDVEILIRPVMQPSSSGMVKKVIQHYMLVYDPITLEESKKEVSTKDRAEAVRRSVTSTLSWADSLRSHGMSVKRLHAIQELATLIGFDVLLDPEQRRWKGADYPRPVLRTPKIRQIHEIAQSPLIAPFLKKKPKTTMAGGMSKKARTSHGARPSRADPHSYSGFYEDLEVDGLSFESAFRSIFTRNTLPQQPPRVFRPIAVNRPSNNNNHGDDDNSTIVSSFEPIHNPIDLSDAGDSIMGEAARLVCDQNAPPRPPSKFTKLREFFKRQKPLKIPKRETILSLASGVAASVSTSTALLGARTDGGLSAAGLMVIRVGAQGFSITRSADRVTDAEFAYGVSVIAAHLPISNPIVKVVLPLAVSFSVNVVRANLPEEPAFYCDLTRRAIIAVAGAMLEESLFAICAPAEFLIPFLECAYMIWDHYCTHGFSTVPSRAQLALKFAIKSLGHLACFLARRNNPILAKSIHSIFNAIVAIKKAVDDRRKERWAVQAPTFWAQMPRSSSDQNPVPVPCAADATQPSEASIRTVVEGLLEEIQREGDNGDVVVLGETGRPLSGVGAAGVASPLPQPLAVFNEDASTQMPASVMEEDIEWNRKKMTDDERRRIEAGLEPIADIPHADRPSRTVTSLANAATTASPQVEDRPTCQKPDGGFVVTDPTQVGTPVVAREPEVAPSGHKKPKNQRHPTAPATSQVKPKVPKNSSLPPKPTNTHNQTARKEKGTRVQNPIVKEKVMEAASQVVRGKQTKQMPAAESSAASKPIQDAPVEVVAEDHLQKTQVAEASVKATKGPSLLLLGNLDDVPENESNALVYQGDSAHDEERDNEKEDDLIPKAIAVTEVCPSVLSNNPFAVLSEIEENSFTGLVKNVKERCGSIASVITSVISPVLMVTLTNNPVSTVAVAGGLTLMAAGSVVYANNSYELPTDLNLADLIDQTDWNVDYEGDAVSAYLSDSTSNSGDDEIQPNSIVALAATGMTVVIHPLQFVGIFRRLTRRQKGAVALQLLGAAITAFGVTTSTPAATFFIPALLALLSHSMNEVAHSYFSGPQISEKMHELCERSERRGDVVSKKARLTLALHRYFEVTRGDADAKKVRELLAHLSTVLSFQSYASDVELLDLLIHQISPNCYKHLRAFYNVSTYSALGKMFSRKRNYVDTRVVATAEVLPKVGLDATTTPGMVLSSVLLATLSASGSRGISTQNLATRWTLTAPSILSANNCVMQLVSFTAAVYPSVFMQIPTNQLSICETACVHVDTDFAASRYPVFDSTTLDYRMTIVRVHATLVRTQLQTSALAACFSLEDTRWFSKPLYAPNCSDMSLFSSLLERSGLLKQYNVDRSVVDIAEENLYSYLQGLGQYLVEPAQKIANMDTQKRIAFVQNSDMVYDDPPTRFVTATPKKELTSKARMVTRNVYSINAPGTKFTDPKQSMLQMLFASIQKHLKSTMQHNPFTALSTPAYLGGLDKQQIAGVLYDLVQGPNVLVINWDLSRFEGTQPWYKNGPVARTLFRVSLENGFGTEFAHLLVDTLLNTPREILVGPFRASFSSGASPLASGEAVTSVIAALNVFTFLNPIQVSTAERFLEGVRFHIATPNAGDDHIMAITTDIPIPPDRAQAMLDAIIETLSPYCEMDCKHYFYQCGEPVDPSKLVNITRRYIVEVPMELEDFGVIRGSKRLTLDKAPQDIVDKHLNMLVAGPDSFEHYDAKATSLAEMTFVWPLLSNLILTYLPSFDALPIVYSTGPIREYLDGKLFESDQNEQLFRISTGRTYEEFLSQSEEFVAACQFAKKKREEIKRMFDDGKFDEIFRPAYVDALSVPEKIPEVMRLPMATRAQEMEHSYTMVEVPSTRYNWYDFVKSLHNTAWCCKLATHIYGKKTRKKVLSELTLKPGDYAPILYFLQDPNSASAFFHPIILWFTLSYHTAKRQITKSISGNGAHGSFGEKHYVYCAYSTGFKRTPQPRDCHPPSSTYADLLFSKNWPYGALLFPIFIIMVSSAAAIHFSGSFAPQSVQSTTVSHKLEHSHKLEDSAPIVPEIPVFNYVLLQGNGVLFPGSCRLTSTGQSELSTIDVFGNRFHTMNFDQYNDAGTKIGYLNETVMVGFVQESDSPTDGNWLVSEEMPGIYRLERNDPPISGAKYSLRLRLNHSDVCPSLGPGDLGRGYLAVGVYDGGGGNLVYVYDNCQPVPSVQYGQYTFSLRMMRALEKDEAVLQAFVEKFRDCPLKTKGAIDYLASNDPLSLHDDDGGASMLYAVTLLAHTDENPRPSVVTSGAPVAIAETMYIKEKLHVVSTAHPGCLKNYVSFNKRCLVLADSSPTSAEGALTHLKCLYRDATPQVIPPQQIYTRPSAPARYATAVTLKKSSADTIPVEASILRQERNKDDANLVHQIGLSFMDNPNTASFRGDAQYVTQKTGNSVFNINGVTNAAILHYFLDASATIGDTATEFKNRPYYTVRVYGSPSGSDRFYPIHGGIFRNGTIPFGNISMRAANILSGRVRMSAGSQGPNAIATASGGHTTLTFNGVEMAFAAASANEMPMIPIKEIATGSITPIGFAPIERFVRTFGDQDYVWPGVNGTTTASWLSGGFVTTSPPTVVVSGIVPNNGQTYDVVSVTAPTGQSLVNARYPSTFRVSISGSVTGNCTIAAQNVAVALRATLVVLNKVTSMTGGISDYSKSTSSVNTFYSDGGATQTFYYNFDLLMPVTGPVESVALRFGYSQFTGFTLTNTWTPQSTGQYQFTIESAVYTPTLVPGALFTNPTNSMETVQVSCVGSTPADTALKLQIAPQEQDKRANLARADLETGMATYFLPYGLLNFDDRRVLNTRIGEVPVPLPILHDNGVNTATLDAKRVLPGEDGMAKTAILDMLAPIAKNIGLPLLKSAASHFLGGSEPPTEVKSLQRRIDELERMVAEIYHEKTDRPSAHTAIRNKTVSSAIKLIKNEQPAKAEKILSTAMERYQQRTAERRARRTERDVRELERGVEESQQRRSRKSSPPSAPS